MIGVYPYVIAPFCPRSVVYNSMTLATHSFFSTSGTVYVTRVYTLRLKSKTAAPLGHDNTH